MTQQPELPFPKAQRLPSKGSTVSKIINFPSTTKRNPSNGGPVLSKLDKLDTCIKKKYPNITWSRTKVQEHFDKNNQIDYYEISYRLLSPSGRWNVTVIWENGKAPILQNVRR